MSYNFLPYHPNFLLTPSIDDWLPEGHLARFISETVEVMDLREIYGYYRANGQGRAAYHPAMRVKVLLYAYCVGITSSRKIEAALVNDVAFRWLSAGNLPDFRCAGGRAWPGVIVLDETKVRARAALCRNRRYKKLRMEAKALRKEVTALLAKADETDRAEDPCYGGRREDEFPEELPTAERRLEWIRRAKAELETAAREVEEEDALGAAARAYAVDRLDREAVLGRLEAELLRLRPRPAVDAGREPGYPGADREPARGCRPRYRQGRRTP
ncbi:transposase [Dissulfurirhabdus thermomarina]|uniref:Transposase n=1 Tax=Dissulfurirhabdus thermomarina TaxID=1765737 RepID=A0A6N9TR14_DISTH|nr:transposase [Dissulfurirhabdus thermomarina]NDY42543.1 transposase [Dissulfurirhabdus thermomarina]NMX23535.1 transposase [Dissulfurirhabdus thermomarina]